MAIRNSTYHEGCIWDPHSEGKGGRRKSAIVLLEREMVVSYTLSLVTIALSLNIQTINNPQFTIESLRRSIQRDVGGSLWVIILGCSLCSRSVMLGSAESEHSRLTNREISFQLRFPTYVITILPKRHGRTDRRTDDLL